MAENLLVTRPGIVGEMLEVLYPDGVPKGEVRRLPRVVMHLDIAATVQRGQSPKLPLHAHFEADPEPLISAQEKCGPVEDQPIPFGLVAPEPSDTRPEGAPSERQRGERPKRGIDWDGEDRFGTMPDGELAALRGCSTESVRLERIRRGIEHYNKPRGGRRGGIDWDAEPRLGKVNPAVLAREYGVNVTTVHIAMKARGIRSLLRRGQRWGGSDVEPTPEAEATPEPEPTPEPETQLEPEPPEAPPEPRPNTKGRKPRIDWDSETRFGTMTDDALGALLECSGQVVQQMRVRKGIPAFCKTGRQRDEAGTPLTHRYRALTIPNKNLTSAELAEGKALTLDDDFQAPPRPTKRSECVDGPRPCPWVSCRYHLAVEVTSTGALKMPHGHVDLAKLADTCALDVADRGVAEGSLEELGARLGVTRERARQEMEAALEKLRDRGVELEDASERGGGEL